MTKDSNINTIIEALRNPFCQACFEPTVSPVLEVEEDAETQIGRSEEQLLGVSLSWVDQYRAICICKSCKIIVHLNCIDSSFALQEIHSDKDGRKVYLFECEACIHKHKLGKTFCVECQQSDGYLMRLKDTDRSFVHFICAFGSAGYSFKSPHLLEVYQASKKQKTVKFLCVFCQLPIKSSFVRCAEKGCLVSTHAFCFYKERSAFLTSIHTIDKTHEALWDNFIAVERMDSASKIEASINEDKVFNQCQNHLKKVNIESKNEIVKNVKLAISEVYEQQVSLFVSMRCDSHTRAYREANIQEEKNAKLVYCDNCFEWRTKLISDNDCMIETDQFMCDKCDLILSIEKSVKEGRLIEEAGHIDAIFELLLGLKNHNIYEILQILRIAFEFKDYVNLTHESNFKACISSLNWLKCGLTNLKKRLALNASISAYNKIVEQSFLKTINDIPKKYLSNFDSKVDFFVKDSLIEEFMHVLAESKDVLEAEQQGFERYMSMLGKPADVTKGRELLTSSNAYMHILEALLYLEHFNSIEVIDRITRIVKCDDSMYLNIAATIRNIKTFVYLYNEKLMSKTESLKSNKRTIIEVFGDSEDQLNNFLYDIIQRSGNNLIQFIVFKRMFEYYDIKVGAKGYVAKNAQDYINNKISLATGNLLVINTNARQKKRGSDEAVKINSSIKKDSIINSLPIQLKYGLLQDFIRLVSHDLAEESVIIQLHSMALEQKIAYLLKNSQRFSNVDELSFIVNALIENTLTVDINEGRLYLDMSDMVLLMRIMKLTDETGAKLQSYMNIMSDLLANVNAFLLDRNSNFQPLIDFCKSKNEEQGFLISKERKFVELICSIMAELNAIPDNMAAKCMLYSPTEISAVMTAAKLAEETKNLALLVETENEPLMDLLSIIKGSYTELFTSLLNVLSCITSCTPAEDACPLIEFVSNLLVACDLNPEHYGLPLVEKVVGINNSLKALLSSYKILTSLNLYIQNDILMNSIDKSTFYSIYNILIRVIKEINQLPEGLKENYNSTVSYLQKFKEYVEIIVFKLLIANNLNSKIQFNITRARISQIKDMIKRVFTGAKGLGSRILIDFFAAYDFIDQFEQIINNQPSSNTQLFNISQKPSSTLGGTALNMLDKSINNPYLRYFNDKKNLMDENKRQLDVFVTKLSRRFVGLSQIVFKYFSTCIINQNLSVVDRLTVDDIFNVSSAMSMVVTPKYNCMSLDDLRTSLAVHQSKFSEYKQKFDALMNKPPRILKLFLNYQYLLIFSKILTDGAKVDTLQNYAYMVERQVELIGFFDETLNYAYNYADMQKVKDRVEKKPFEESDLIALTNVVKYMNISTLFSDRDIRAIEMLMKVSYNHKASSPSKSMVDLKRFDELKRCIENATFKLSTEFENRVYGPVSKHQHLIDVYDRYYKNERPHKNYLLCKYIHDELGSIQVDFNDINDLLKPYDKDMRYYKKFYGELKTHVAKKTGTNFNQFLKYYQEIRDLNALSNQRKMILTFNIINVCFNRLLPDLISTMRNTSVDNLVKLFDFFCEMSLMYYGKTPQLKPYIDELVWVTYLRFIDLFLRKMRPDNRPACVTEIQDNIIYMPESGSVENLEQHHANDLSDLNVEVDPLMFSLMEYIKAGDQSRYVERDEVSEEDVHAQYVEFMRYLENKIEKRERGFDNPKLSAIAERTVAKEGIVAQVRFIFKVNMPLVEERFKIDEKEAYEKVERTFIEEKGSKSSNKAQPTNFTKRTNSIINNLNLGGRISDETLKDKLMKAIWANKNIDQSKHKIYINSFAIDFERQAKIKELRAKDISRVIELLASCKNPEEIIKGYFDKSLSLMSLISKAKEFKLTKVEKGPSVKPESKQKFNNFFEAALDEIEEGIKKENNILEKRENLFAHVKVANASAPKYPDIFGDEPVVDKKENKQQLRPVKQMDDRKRINERFKNSRGICYELKLDNQITFTFTDKFNGAKETISTTVKPRSLISFNMDLSLNDLRLSKINCAFKNSSVVTDVKKSFAHSLIANKDIGFHLNETIFGYVYLESLDLPPVFAENLANCFYTKGEGFSVYLYSSWAVPPEIIEVTKMFGLTSQTNIKDLRNLFFYFIKIKSKDEGNAVVNYSLQRKTDQADQESLNLANQIRLLQKTGFKAPEPVVVPQQPFLQFNIYPQAPNMYNAKPTPPNAFFSTVPLSAPNMMAQSLHGIGYNPFPQFPFNNNFNRAPHFMPEPMVDNNGVSEEDRKLEQLYEDYKKKTEDAERNEYMIMVSRRYPELFYRLSNKIKGYT